MRKRALGIVVFAVCAAVFGLSKSDAAADPSSSAEYAVKAAFLYNVSKFVEWPATAWNSDSDSFLLVILGGDPFGDTLNALQSKDVRGRRIVVRRVTAVENVGRCHILFISNSERDRVRDIADRFRNRPVLIMGDTNDFTRQGGMVNLMKRENKIQLEINPNAAARSGLKISSQLLKLAILVGGE